MSSAAGLSLDAQVVASLQERLPAVARHAVTAITEEVDEYAGALTGSMGTTIEQTVQVALGAFLRLAEQSESADPGTPLQAALDGAYALGRGEARAGRSTAALLAAYRVGARVSWREFSSTAVEGGLPAAVLARFAELVFAYIDQLSAASVAGHTDELETSGRLRRRLLDRLGEDLLAGAPHDALVASAARADWPPPATLTAVLLPVGRVRGVLAALDPRALTVSGVLPGSDADEIAVLLVPDADGADRVHLVRAVSGPSTVVGPSRPWTRAAASYRRAVRALALIGRDALVDTEQHLTRLVLTADPEALADLRARALAPLAGLRPTTADRLAETLRSWLLHQGRREDVAADLVVHPQTVRYRMTQVRDLYGDRLTDPEAVLELTLALATPPDEPSVASTR